MPIENMALPWYMGPTKAPWEAAIEGIHAGSQIRSNQIQTQRAIAESEQNLQRQETATQLKLIDLGLEGERNQLAKQAFMVRQDADLTRAKGMSEIGAYLGDATKNNKLTDPETQAGFWNLTSKYAPFVNEQTVNSMWDNTFKAAMDRKDRADTHGRVPASAQIDQIASDLENQADELFSSGFEAESKKIADRAKGLRVANRLVPPNSGPPEVGQIDLPGGGKLDYYMANGKLNAIKPPKDNMSDLHRMQYAAELKALNYKLEHAAFDPSEKLNKKEPDAATYNRLFKELSAKYESMAGSHAAPASTSDPLGLFSK